MLERAGTWAARSHDQSFPDEVIHHAKRAIIDWVAAVVPGGTMPPAQALTRALVNDREQGDAELIPGGQRVPMRTAALINGTAAHTAEVDDIFRDGVYHPGAPTIAAALAAAQSLGHDGDDLIRAVIVGFEVGTRVAATIQPAHYRFWHTTGTVGTLGAAAAVATILRLTPGQFAHAVANATTMAAGLQQAFRSDAMSKPLHAGHAADAGTMAALVAADGFTGVPDILDGEAGFGAAMSDSPSWSSVFDDLGSRYNITAMTFKNHACCGHTFAAIDGALELRANPDLDATRVERVEVATYGTALKVAGNPAPTTQFEAQFSIPYCIAAALEMGSVRLAAFEPSRLASPSIRALVDRVELSVDPELDANFPTQRGARVRITMEDGMVHESVRPTRKGDPDLPLTDEELNDKYTELVSAALGPARTSALAASLWSLEKQRSVTGLTGALTEDA